MVWACEKFRHYLWGRKFTMRSAHEPSGSVIQFWSQGFHARRPACRAGEACLLAFSFQVEYVHM